MKQLYYQSYGDTDNEVLIVLHGLFGSSDNWKTLCKRFSESYYVIALDLRNHGRSFHDSNMTYVDMVEDVKSTLNILNIKSAVILGHSMGGKVAMGLALTYPEMTEKLIVVDIAPKFYERHHDDILEGLKSVELNSISSRKDADELLASHIDCESVRQFLLKNLKGIDRKFHWQINLDAIVNGYTDIMDFPFKGYAYEGETMFISGANSDYIKKKDEDLIRNYFRLALIKDVPNAGHWVHAEQSETVLAFVIEFTGSRS